MSATNEDALRARVKRIREASGMHFEACKRQAKLDMLVEDFDALTTRRALLETENQDLRDLIDIVGRMLELIR